MAATYCYKKGQHGLFHTWKLRYLEYDASSKMLVYRTAQGGKIQGQFVVSGVNPDHKDTAGHSQVFEILHADGTEPLLCAGLISGKDPSHPSSYPKAKEEMVRAIQASFSAGSLPKDIQIESDRIRKRVSTEIEEAVAFGVMSTAEITAKTMPGMTKVVAVASRDVSKAMAFIEKNAKITKGRTIGEAVTYDELITHPAVQAIYCPLPTGVRNEWLRKAAAAGKHIYAEKPMGGSVKELKELFDECEKKGVQFMDGTMWYHSNRTREIEKVLASGELGPVRTVNASFTFHFPDQDWLDGGNGRTDKSREPMGCLGDQGWYPLSAILWAFGWELPERVVTTSTTLNKIDTIVACSGVLYFKGGRIATFDCGVTSAHRSQYEIVCEEGNIRVDDLVGGQGRSGNFDAYFGPYVGSGKYTKGDIMGKDTVVEVDECDHVDALVEDFSACVHAIQNGGQPDQSWPKRSLAVHTVMSAVFESANNGGKMVPVVNLSINPIIVLGSSGNVGKATLAALSDAGVPATAGVRDPSPTNSKNEPLLAMDGVTLVQADMSKPETLAPAIAEGATVLIIAPGHIDRSSISQTAIKAATTAKAGHIVVVSVVTAALAKKSIFGDQFKPIEEAARSCGIPFTLVRLPMFMDNNLGQPIKDGAIYMPIGAEKDMSAICASDIGFGISNILQRPWKFAGRTLNFGGVTTNFTATAAAYGKVLGKAVSYTQVPPEAAKESMMGAGWPEWQVDGVLELAELINEGDPTVNIPDVENHTIEVLGRKPKSPEAFMDTFKGMFLPPSPPNMIPLDPKKRE